MSPTTTNSVRTEASILKLPVASSGIVATPPSLRVRRHDVLGGLIHEYYSEAA